jgi:uncharacterized damage-inducible protein DinB
MNTDFIISALEAAPALITPLVRELPPGYVKRRPQPNKWSAHEHFCHLLDCHSLFFSRLEKIFSENEPLLTPFSPDDEADALLNMDFEQAAERFARERADLGRRLRAFSPSDWERTARHPEYERYSLFIMFRHMALHDMLHAYRIEELALMKRDW